MKPPKTKQLGHSNTLEIPLNDRESSDAFRGTIKSCLQQFQEILNDETAEWYDISRVESLESAQQCVLLLTIRTRPSDGQDGKDRGLDKKRPPSCQSELGKNLVNAIKEGNSQVILRIWMGAARWWNLYSNKEESCFNLARAEVTGYELARKAFELHYRSKSHKGTNSDGVIAYAHQSRNPHIRIPKALYFHISGTSLASEKEGNHVGSVQTTTPWAVFSNVRVLPTTGKERWEFCDEFVRNMVKVRHEFGFDEPHPRHGRVCIDGALDYATHVLETIIVPLHSIFFKYSVSMSKIEGRNEKVEYDMIRKKISILSASSFRYASHLPQDGSAFKYSDMIKLHQYTLSQVLEKIRVDGQDEGINELVSTLEECVSHLSTEAKQLVELPAVLCHMDLQPQNMILYQLKNNSCKIPRIASVLDWEESCYADPRFEILLLCRKVVANRNQADALWNRYSQVVQYHLGTPIGPIEPWLRLEAVHSLLTMCMQGMDLQGGGRNPWEGKSDLRKKINRELFRLRNDLGCNFCKQL